MAASSLLLDQLAGLKNQRVKVFIASGKAYTGTLRKYDNDVIVVGGAREGDADSTVLLDQVSSFRAANTGE